jgi:hypothetical protein
VSTPVDAIKAIRAHLLADDDIPDVVGDKVVALGTMTQYEWPCIVLALQGGETNRTLEGDDDEQRPDLQIDIYSPDYDQAKSLHDLVYDRLTSINRNTVGGHELISCAVEQPRDDSEPLLIGETIPDYYFSHIARPWLKRL